MGGSGAWSPDVLGAVVSSRDRSVKLWSRWFDHTGTQVLLGRRLQTGPSQPTSVTPTPQEAPRNPKLLITGVPGFISLTQWGCECGLRAPFPQHPEICGPVLLID